MYSANRNGCLLRGSKESRGRSSQQCFVPTETKCSMSEVQRQAGVETFGGHQRQINRPKKLMWHPTSRPGGASPGPVEPGAPWHRQSVAFNVPNSSWPFSGSTNVWTSLSPWRTEFRRVYLSRDGCSILTGALADKWAGRARREARPPVKEAGRQGDPRARPRNGRHPPNERATFEPELCRFPDRPVPECILLGGGRDDTERRHTRS